MRKRKREVLEEEPSSEATVATVTLEPCKKAKQGKDSFGELTSLLSSEDSLVAGTNQSKFVFSAAAIEVWFVVHVSGCK